MKIVLNLEADGEDADGEPILVDIEKAVAAAVTDRIAHAIEKHILEQIATEIKAKIGVHVHGWVETAVTKPIQRTTSYGQPVGDPISFEELVAGIAQKWLTDKVDTYGGDRSTASLMRIEWVVRRYANELVQTELAKTLNEHREQLAKAIGEIVAASATAIKT